MNETKDILQEGLWSKNALLVQLLGLCPSLAVSNTVSNAVGLGLTTTLVLICTNSIVSIMSCWIPHEIRTPIHFMIIASVVSSIQMLVNAYAFNLYQSLGIFIPLIVTNCVVIGRLEAAASKKSPVLAALDGLAIGLGSTCILFILGALREILSNGTLFENADQLLGKEMRVLYVELFYTETPFLLAKLPPGAFIILGFILSGKNFINQLVNFNHQRQSS